MNKLRVAIFGASGYSGAELLRYLARHPRVEIVALAADSSAGKSLDELYPALRGLKLPVLDKLDAASLKGKADLVFLALPHTESMKLVPEMLAAGLKIIDLSGDFRLADASQYPEWYKVEHLAKGHLGQAVYGLSEVHGDLVKKASLVANPGCYTTTSILALYPLMQAGWLKPGSIIIDAKSGVTGAGRKLTQSNAFAEVDGNFSTYKVGGVHQHTPEIEQELSEAAGQKVTVTFTPHLLPLNRGILATSYGDLAKPGEAKDLLKTLADFYSGKPFVRVLTDGSLPTLRDVVGTNLFEVGLKVDARTQRAIVVSATDNLGKGAAGQAVQNMNLMFGFEETAGLDVIPLPV
jgi:N-acetyl-gamma-glutamyl-phosphate reductase